MVRKLTRPGPQKPSLNPEILAVGFALALVGGLFVAMFGGAGTLRRNGCGAGTWRNPVTGRTEWVGPAPRGQGEPPACR